jgi:hypothetical protein
MHYNFCVHVAETAIIIDNDSAKSTTVASPPAGY